MGITQFFRRGGVLNAWSLRLGLLGFIVLFVWGSLGACSSPRVKACESQQDCESNYKCIEKVCLDCSLHNCNVTTQDSGGEPTPKEPEQESVTEPASEPVPSEPGSEPQVGPEPGPEAGPEAGPEPGPEAGPEPKPELPPEEPKKPTLICQTPPGLPKGPVPSQRHLQYQSQTYDIVSGTPAPYMDISPNGNWIAIGGQATGLVQIWKWNKDRYVFDKALWTGHTKGIRSIRISRDSKFVATGGVDFAIRVWRINDGTLRHTLERHYSHVYGIDFSPDGKQLISAGYYDYRIRLWDLSTGLQIKEFYNRVGSGNSSSSAVLAVRFSPDGKSFVTGSNDDFVKVWDIASGKRLWAKKSHSSDVWSVEYSPDGKNIVSGGTDRRARIWDASNGTVLHTLNNPNTTSDGYVYSASYSQDGSMVIVSGGSDRWVYFWDVKNKVYLYRSSALRHASTTHVVRFRPDGKQAVSVGYDHQLRVWDLGTKPALNRNHDVSLDIRYEFEPHPNGKSVWVINSNSIDVELRDTSTNKLIGTWSGHVSGVRALGLSPDKKTLATASSAGTVLLWDVATGKVLRSIKQAHSLPINDVVFEPSGKRLATVSDDGDVKLWNTSDGKLLNTLSGHKGRVYQAAFDPNGTILVTVGEDAKPHVWSMSNLSQAPKTLDGHTGYLYAVAFDPQGKTFVTTGWDRKIRVWDASSLTFKSEVVSHNGLIRSLTFSSDGKMLATASYDRMVKLWDVVNGGLLETFHGHVGLITQVRFKSLTQLQSIGWDHALRTWDIKSTQQGKTLQGHTDEVTAIAYSPNGAWLASGSKDKTIRIWDPKTDKTTYTLTGHTGAITSLDWNKSSTKLVAGDDNKQIRVWDMATQKDTALPDAHQAALVSVRFGPDGSWVISISRDGQVRMWSLSQSKLLREWKTPAGVTVTAATLSTDGKHLLTTHSDRYIRFWTTADGKLHRSERRHSSTVRSVDYDKQTYYAVTGGDDNSLRLFRVPGNTYSRGLYGMADDVVGSVFSPEGEFIAAAIKNNTIALWRWRESHLMKIFTGHKGAIRGMSFHPEGNWLASASADKEIKLWPIRQTALANVQYMTKFTGTMSLAYDGTQHALAVSGDNTYVRLHTASDRINRRSMYIHSGSVRALAFHPTKNWLFSGSDDRTLRITNAKTSTHSTLRSFNAHQQSVTSIALAKQATRLYSGSKDQTIKVWQLEPENKTAPILLDILTHGGNIHQLRASEDGKWLLSWASDKTVRLWNVENGQLQRTYRVNGTLAGIALRPDGKLLTVATTDGKVRVWLTEEEAEEPNYTFAMKAKPLVMRFDPKSRWLAVALEGQGTAILEAECFRELKRFKGSFGIIQSMAWSHSGHLLFLGDASGGVTAWLCPDCAP